MKKILPLFLSLTLIAGESQGQFSRYLVKLKNKGNNPYSLSAPLGYLSIRSVLRRARFGIALDSTDLPVTPSYVTQIRNVPNVSILNVSKWLNSISIRTSDANAITTISGFPFVQSVTALAARGVGDAGNTIDKFGFEENTNPYPLVVQRVTSDYYNYGTGSYNEIHLHNGEFLHDIGLRGQGMMITMLDAGFYHYTTLQAFDSVNLNGQILSTWDFVDGNGSVVEDFAHGMQCLSTIAANIPGQFIGKAPKATFNLFRTEDVATEYPVEEHNWVCGAERADSAGTDVISSSLGYNTFDNSTFNHTYADMDGNSTMSAIGADLAAKKGILVFNAVGNEGGNTWHYLITPSDGDSVVAVGAVNISGVVAGFSSYGPSFDGRIKPDVASIGVSALIQGTNNSIATGSGTSFACPNMAGLGTCLWQGFPEFNNMKIVRAMQQAGSIAGSPDNRVGYGIPNMKLAFTNLLVDYATSSAVINACTVNVSWSSKDVGAMKYEVERKAPGESVYTKIADVIPQAGDILTNHSYQYNNTLVSVPAGIVSYRIRQIVDTAAATFTAVYIDTANVTVASGCFPTGTGDPNQYKKVLTIQPNPASDNQVTLVIETAYAISHMPIVVYDAKGRLMLQVAESKGSGKKTVQLPLIKLAKGKYYIKVLDGQKALGTAELIRL